MQQVPVYSLFVGLHFFGSENFPVDLLCRLVMGVLASTGKMIESSAWVASVCFELEAMLSEILELE